VIKSFGEKRNVTKGGNGSIPSPNTGAGNSGVKKGGHPTSPLVGRKTREKEVNLMIIVIDEFRLKRQFRISGGQDRKEQREGFAAG